MRTRADKKNPQPRRERRRMDRLRAEHGIALHDNGPRPGTPAAHRRSPRDDRGRLGPPAPGMITRAKTLRKQGKSYSEIDRAMGFPPRSGPSRSWYLVNAPDEYRRLRKETRRRATVTHRARSGPRSTSAKRRRKASRKRKK